MAVLATVRRCFCVELLNCTILFGMHRLKIRNVSHGVVPAGPNTAWWYDNSAVHNLNNITREQEILCELNFAARLHISSNINTNIL